MLQSMREKMSGLVTGIIIGVISLVFVLWGIGSYFEAGPAGSETVATVGTQKITEYQVSNELNNMRERLLSKGVTDLNDPKWREDALKTLVDRALQVSGAGNLGVTVDPKQVDESIYQTPQFMESGQFSMALYNRFIQNSGMSTSMLKQYLSDQLSISQVASGIAMTDFSLPVDVQKRDIRYVWLTNAEFKDKVKLTNKQLQAFYSTHKADYKKPAEVSVKYILLSLNELAKDAKISDAVAEQYYENNKLSYQEAEQRQASQILLPLAKDAKPAAKEKVEALAQKIEKELKAGADFSKLAAQHSKDSLSAKKGGDMGWVTLPESPNSFEKALFELKKTGDVSSPITTAYGVQIIKLTGIQAKKVESYSKAKIKTIEQLKQQKAEIAYSSVGNKLANLTFENPDSLSFAAKQLNLTVKETKLFDYKGLKSGVASHEKVIEAAFSDNVLKNKNNSDVVNISPTEAVVVRLSQHHPETIKPFDKVKDQVESQLSALEEQKAALKEANNLVASLNAKGKDTLKLKWLKGESLSRGDKLLPANQMKAIFSSALSTKVMPSYHFSEDGEKGILVYEVTKVEASDNKKADQGLAIYGRMLQQVQSANTYSEYLSYLHKTISIEKSE